MRKPSHKAFNNGDQLLDISLNFRFAMKKLVEVPFVRILSAHRREITIDFFYSIEKQGFKSEL